MADANAKGKGKAPALDEPENPQMMRITSSGKMTAWVAFALDFLEKHEDIPIVLHTLPAPPKPAPDPASADAPPPRAASASNATSTIPRLISVVEIIKREYLKKLELAHSSTLSGLHQYNEVDTLEALGLGAPGEGPELDAAARRSQEIAAALGGKTHLKTRQTPFMKITLSRVELTGLSSATCEYSPFYLGT
ncbi:hypothetical protein B0H10DRAFT_141954 [Mycena sp. CBHHK59/15]|nr:hypothetical protein B0H10DRAFT_141954 [Mycena sp. CBHHK59/15]